MTRLVILPGDGIGPEITAVTKSILEQVSARFALQLSFEQHEVGLASLKREGTTFPAKVLEACRAADGVVIGPVSHLDYPPKDKGGANPSGGLRIALDLFANVRPARSRKGLPHYGRTGMDLVIVRENTEGFYADRNMHLGIGEFMPTPDVALSVRKITAQGSRRIARAAFEMARTRRKHVTAVHKLNVLKITEGLFLQEVRGVAKDFPDVTLEEQLVDSMAALLVRDAARFDVVLTTNMYGDILSDEAAELSGSLGLAASINAGERHCMAQAQHGSAPDIAGRDKANPASLVLSAGMLLGWLGSKSRKPGFLDAQAAIERAVDALIESPKTRTGDLGGELGTRAFGDALAKRLNSGSGT
jgi:isocitrate/isopropylmalate dehydrogenase